MKGKIFSGEDYERRICVKKVPVKPSEAVTLLNYTGCNLPEESVSKKPSDTKISKADVMQKQTLSGIAKVYSQRILKSQVVMGNAL